MKEGIIRILIIVVAFIILMYAAKYILAVLGKIFTHEVLPITIVVFAGIIVLILISLDNKK
jgi:hypothetical protein